MVAACVPGLAQRTYNLGSTPPPEEINALDQVPNRPETEIW
jgi:hypothetical protein